MKSDEFVTILEEQARLYRKLGKEEDSELLKAAADLIFWDGDHVELKLLEAAVDKIDTWDPNLGLKDDGDKIPSGTTFMSEVTLYNLIGKNDARTFLRYWSELKSALESLKDSLAEV